MVSQLQKELAILASQLPEETREHMNFIKELPQNLLQKYIPGYTAKVETQTSRRVQDYGNEYESTLDVLAAIQGDNVEKLLTPSKSLFDKTPAKILNVVASVKLANSIDLEQLAQNAWNVEYNKKNFSGLVIQISHPEATGIVYSTGRMIITGARCEKDSKEAAMQCIRVISKAGCKINAGDSYRVQNICATINLGYRIRIHEMGANKHNIENAGKVINYTPEIFAGLVCSFESPKVTVVCFATGTLLFSGAHREQDVQVALERFRYLSYPYRY